TLGPLSRKSLVTFLHQLVPGIKDLDRPGSVPSEKRPDFDPEERQLRQVSELEQNTQQLIQKSRHVRDAYFWDKTSITTPVAWKESRKNYPTELWDKVIARIPSGQLPLKPHSRQIYNETAWSGYE